VDFSTLYLWVGFLLASYSVIANDSVQTLGTWIASNSERFRWYILWSAASTVLLFTLWYGWSINDGDISYGRLNKIPWQPIQWYHAVAPLILVALTRFGVPVSTTFLVLSAFASTVVLEKVLMKSALGYLVAAAAAYLIWMVVAKFWESRKDIPESHDRYWRVAQWCTTGWLWFTWLSHDMANIAVFLPRQVPTEAMILISIIFVGGMGYMFYERGGKIQEVVLSKTNTKYVRSATLVDLIYSLILWYFKGYNDIPMSTTWVFVGLLAGRELAFATINDKYKFKTVFPLVGRDFFKMMIGLSLSIVIVLAIHGISFRGLANM
jgi:phosphate/sulfate permease